MANQIITGGGGSRYFQTDERGIWYGASRDFSQRSSTPVTDIGTLSQLGAISIPDPNRPGTAKVAEDYFAKLGKPAPTEIEALTEIERRQNLSRPYIGPGSAAAEGKLTPETDPYLRYLSSQFNGKGGISPEEYKARMESGNLEEYGARQARLREELESMSKAPLEGETRAGVKVDEFYKGLFGGEAGKMGLPQAPPKPDIAGETARLQQLNLDPLERDYNDANAALTDYQNKILAEQDRIKGQQVSSRVISGQLVKLNADMAEGLRQAEARVKETADIYNTKQKSIAAIMDAMKTDYNSARSDYEFAVNKAFQFQGLMNQDRNDAQASLTAIQNQIKEGAFDPATAGDTFNSYINDLDLRAGNPLGYSQFVFQNIEGKQLGQFNWTDEGGNDFRVVLTKKPSGDVEKNYIYIGKGKTDSDVTAGNINNILAGIGLPLITANERGELTKSAQDKLLKVGIPYDDISGIFGDIKAGYSLDQIRNNLAAQFGKDKGFDILDNFMSALQE